VGEALFPSDVHATFDEGLWLDGEGFDRAAPAELNEVDGVQRQVAIEVADGASEEEVVAALQASVGDQFQELGPALTPVELTNLENVRTLPWVLAGFLALLAVGALGHVLATAARRRRKDFAVLRALGLTRWDSRVVLNVQGTVIGLVGLLVGIPAGIVLGQLGWAVVAESVPLAVVRPVAALAVAALIPLALLVANGLAVWPGRRVARLRPGEVLRTE
jgi:ABC-type antimicrobial peptide transport system permease subunit